MWSRIIVEKCPKHRITITELKYGTEYRLTPSYVIEFYILGPEHSILTVLKGRRK